jgi:hypothetical protein
MSESFKGIRDNFEYKDPFVVLGIRRGAGANEINAAYRNLAKKFHPDMTGQDGGKMALINAARDLALGMVCHVDSLGGSGLEDNKIKNAFKHMIPSDKSRVGPDINEIEAFLSDKFTFIGVLKTSHRVERRIIEFVVLSIKNIGRSPLGYSNFMNVLTKYGFDVYKYEKSKEVRASLLEWTIPRLNHYMNYHFQNDEMRNLYMVTEIGYLIARSTSFGEILREDVDISEYLKSKGLPNFFDKYAYLFTKQIS